MTAETAGSGQDVRYGTASARWVLAATVLGSGVAFLDSTVVNVALPSISSDLHTSISGLQWTVDAYLVTLSALLLLGGSLGDRYGRRLVFVAGLAAFSGASIACAVAPSAGALIAARGLQGVGAALLVPGSLALIAATFHRDDRPRAIGAWSGLSGITSAVGPFLGGWLVDSVSWRLIFLINLPIAAVAAFIALRHVPETRAPVRARLDLPGAGAATVALAALSYAAIEHRGSGAVLGLVVAALTGALFFAIERASSHPMLPLAIFRSWQFSGANLTTFAVYGALGAALFLVVIRLEVSLGYSALEAGAALVPFTLLMVTLSPAAGQLGQRIGARVPMTVGPLVIAAGMVLFGELGPGSTYLGAVLPAVLVFGAGMTVTVAPLTAAVLGGVTDAFVGVASGINNAVARFAGLMAVALLPALAGIDSGGSIGATIDAGYATALRASAALCAAGGVVALVSIRRTTRTVPVTQPAPFAACHHPGVARPSVAPAAGAAVTAPPGRDTP